jgi:hypothetical protein
METGVNVAAKLTSTPQSRDGDARVKKLITTLTLLTALAACHSGSSSTTMTTTTPAPAMSGSQAGAPDALTAVRTFMGAAKTQDLQVIGGIWGDSAGPARERFGRQELEQRELIMLRCLRHDRYDIIGDAPNPGGARSIVVQITLGDLTRSSNFEVTHDQSSRWYVRKFDMLPLQDICSHRAT